MNGSAAKAAQPAPLGKFSTNTCWPPATARSADVMATVNLFELTKVAVRKRLLTNTRLSGANPLPLIVSVKFGPPETAAAGLRLVTVTGAVVVL